jgi:hypothetical protein
LFSPSHYHPSIVDDKLADDWLPFLLLVAVVVWTAGWLAVVSLIIFSHQPQVAS